MTAQHDVEADTCKQPAASAASGCSHGSSSRRHWWRARPLSPKQEAHLVELYRGGGRTIGELEELFSVTRSTIYRAGDRES